MKPRARRVVAWLWTASAVCAIGLVYFDPFVGLFWAQAIVFVVIAAMKWRRVWD